MFDLETVIYKEYLWEDIPKLKKEYGLRSNKSCDSAALSHFLYRNSYHMSYYLDSGKAMILKYEGDHGEAGGFIPFCREEDLVYYFKLQEEYFNKVLGKPLSIYYAEEEGVELLKNAGALDNYIVEELPGLDDYIYDAESMRTLAGRKLSQKRNHINSFLKEFEDRWEYRHLTYDDKDDIITFMRHWFEDKTSNVTDDEENPYNLLEDLPSEIEGIENTVSVPEAYELFRMGGIYIDGKLKAFSMGDYNETDKMAIITVEAADSSIRGLYQVINKEFLIHEYPDALLVNRENDAGIPGMQRAKQSYYPVHMEKKYVLKQNIRFIPKRDHDKTLELFIKSFGEQPDFAAEYYGDAPTAEDDPVTGRIRVLAKRRIAVMEDEDGNYISMAHVLPCKAVYEDGREIKTSLILCVATDSDHRNKGYMRDVMLYVMNQLKEEGLEFCFLLAVNKAYYKSLGFVYHWDMSEEELDYLHYDDGITGGSAALLNGDGFETPYKIIYDI